tara:strand:+ start:2479 stop:3057 length:579 start_codon:yes stop_codon:yes gene_type:complete
MDYSYRKFSYKKKFCGNFLELAKLFYSASHEYKIFFSRLKINKVNFIKSIINKKNSELEQITVAYKKYNLIGLISGFPLEEFRSRKLSSLLVIRSINNSNNVINFIKKNLIKVSLKKKRFYLSKLAVNKKCEGKGIGNKLLNKLIKDIDKKKFTYISLHVEKKNHNAVSFYLNRKFQIKEASNSLIYMEKKI